MSFFLMGAQLGRLEWAPLLGTVGMVDRGSRVGRSLSVGALLREPRGRTPPAGVPVGYVEKGSGDGILLP